MFIIKIGGSIITDKAIETGAFKKQVMDNISKSLASAGKDYIIVHGAGSFGHVLAKKYEINKGLQTKKQHIGYAETLTKVQELNTYVLKSLQRQGLPAVSIPPHATMILDNHNEYQFQTDIFETYINKGFLPVSYGDVVLDKALGCSICSGDLLMESLTKRFHPEHVIFVIDEDGLYNENPKKNPKAQLIEHITTDNIHSLQTSLDDHADVTGGMKGKIDTILKIISHDVDVLLLNGNKPDRLYEALKGNKTRSTLIQR